MPQAHEISSIEQERTASPRQNAKGLTFWLIMTSICISVFLSALELTSVSTALPTIVDNLHGGDFVWIGSAYALASTAVLPASGGLAEIFGRRITMLSALLLFALGSALCGAAQSMNFLIAARETSAVQGVGGGGILSLGSIILSDLVSLEERGVYNGFIALAWGSATAIGPLVGGALAQKGQWRWIFYLNLPITGFAIALVVACVRLRTPGGTWTEKLARIDWIGNVLVTASTISCCIALTWAGIRFPWSSARVLVPLILGLLGLGVFLIYEGRIAKHPIVPPSLLSNRTSFSGYLQTTTSTTLSVCTAYYLPIYIQACKGHSPLRSGVDILGLTLMLGPSLLATGVSVTITKRYRPQLWIGWIILSTAIGLLCLLKADSSVSLIVGLPVLSGTAYGIIASATYFPTLAPLPVSENAHALALFSFCRSFAGAWGTTIGGTILQNELSRHLPRDYLAQFSGGAEIAFSAIPTIRTLPEPLRTAVRVTFANANRKIWEVMTALAVFGLLVSLLMKGLPLHHEKDEKWGVENKQELAAPGGEIVVMDVRSSKSSSEQRLDSILEQTSHHILPMNQVHDRESHP